MSSASFASLTLARFDDIREMGPLQPRDDADCHFFGCGADLRAAGSFSKSMKAYKFAILGLHGTEESARATMAARGELAPWIAEAREVWSGVLQPFRHFGEANFLDRSAPGPLYGEMAPVPPDDEPILIMTSVGWNSTDGETRDRIMRFSEGVTAVRVSMSGVPGLASQQTFSLPGLFDWDGFTVTFWQNLGAAMAFAYGPGLHRDLVKVQRTEVLGDRTSFTRFRILASEGVWHGF